MAAQKAKQANPLPKQADHTTQPYTGPLTLDLTPAAKILVDLPKGGRRGLRKAGKTIDDVVAELAVAVPTDGAAAGIAQPVYQDFTTRTQNIDLLLPLYQQASKIADVLRSTLAINDDAREQDLGKITDSIRSTAKRSKSAAIKAPFKETLAYKSAAANKGVKTRTKKKEQAAPAAAAPAAPAAPAAAAPAAPAAGH